MSVDSGCPFSAGSVNSNPSFAPAKVTTYSQVSGKCGKPPKPPEKPLMPYMRFSRKVWDRVRNENETSKLWEIGKVIGQMWRELAPQDKHKFVQEWETEKVQYSDALKAYHNSPAYKQFLSHKEKEKQANEEKTSKQANAAHSSKNEQIKISIPALEQDTEDADQLSSRQIAAARFHRNQKLLLDIFSDSCVPDSRTIVTTPRISMLKKQVHSLSTHQKKLETELGQIDEQFQAKKIRIQENATDFARQLDKFSRPAVSPAKYKELVEEAEKKIMLEIEENEKKAKLPENGNLETKNEEITGADGATKEGVISGGNEGKEGKCGEGQEISEGNEEKKPKIEGIEEEDCEK